MDKSRHARQIHHAQVSRWSLWAVGLGSLAWLLLRCVPKPARLAYPCQRAALTNSVGFAGYVLSLFGGVQLYHRWRRAAPLRAALAAALCLLLATLQGSLVAPAQPIRAAATLPAWTSATAVSDVFAVTDAPAPTCSLDGGDLPTTPPCSDPATALHDDAVDALITLMAAHGLHLYRTDTHPGGLVAADGIVVIKINNQWGGQGEGDGHGRLATNTDVLKGLIWRILQHPAGFTGEVVVAENTQGETNWDVSPANAQDPNQSYQDVVSAFQEQGHPVSRFDWSLLNESTISGGAVDAGGSPTGEYAGGNNDDAYILLEDAAGSGMNELSYPKFRTAGGAYVSMRYGVWNGSSYDADRLTFINLPVLKRHGMAGATIAWKNLIGFVTISNYDGRYGGWDPMHRYFWGYEAESGDPDYGLLGRQLALVRAPDLNIVDAIWVGYEDNTSGNANRQDILLASTDPFAVDWYASEYVLRPLATDLEFREASAARGGTFRSATRTNQDVAAANWPGEYPYINLLDSDAAAPSAAERNQMNVFVGSENPPPVGTALFLPLVRNP